ncbi:hypothetical protein ETAA8_49600 [Anatilimnocola aggregata]|uniref:Peptidase C-terminal archaeal/bacterial domain-containing protein n=1 Tax=Anatilimnocola aggregata TaxID=2528021 RepID=A0A517YI08_9BACT|nr:pre-peptidase C-terminal domain-containing protein [Anatilimnocola aggregata]QDU29844.1 hypothetical protein ETAA8_49600 [Anatilimnocola aggregata]
MAALDLAALKQANFTTNKSRSSAQAATLVDDSYEQNDTRTTARNLGTLTGNKTFSNLVQADANDWYRFTTTTKPGATANITLAFQNAQGDLDLELYSFAGARLKASVSLTDNETVSLSGLAAGTYYVRVYGYNGQTNPSYNLSVNLSGTVTPPPVVTDDSYEDNDTLATASVLGTLPANVTMPNLRLVDANDWFSFTTAGAGTTTHKVALAFQNSQGNLALQLYNSAGVLLSTSNGTSNAESVSLSGRAAGTYYARVYSATGATNPAYSLQIVAPLAPVTPPTPPTLPDDTYENNDTQATASSLGTLNSSTTINSLVLADANDWYGFTTVAAGGSSNVISMSFQNSQGNLALQLVNAAGTVLATSDGTGNSESVSLSGLAAGNYFARVYSATGATNPSYSLQIVAPVPVTNPPPTGTTDDAYENNDTQATASNLGTLNSNVTISNLVLADAADWFRFTTVATGRPTDSVSITFQNSQGNLGLELVNGSGVVVGSSNGTGNTETISIATWLPGTYFVRIFGAANPSYSMQFVAPITLTDDSYEQNDTFATASNLGTLSANVNLANLVLADSDDWYRFTTTATGTTTNLVSIGFQQTQGNLSLQLVNSLGAVVLTSETTANTESVSLNGLAAGTYYARVYSATGATNANYSLQIVNPTTSTGTSAFDIQVNYVGFTASQQAIFDQAAARWEAIIVGDLPTATYNSTTVDDLLIDASAIPIDGVSGILGQAGPDRLRATGTRLPYHGIMQFDSADMANMEANGSLLNVIIHEMGHVLGFGTLWQSRGLVSGAGTLNPLFLGPQAVAAYNSIFSTTGTGIPLENTGGSGTADSHWREVTLRNEIMTGYINAGVNPLSAISIASMADLGYTVNMSVADAYTRPPNSTLLIDATGGTTVQFNSTQPVLIPVVAQNPAALAGFATWARLDSLSAAINAIANANNRTNSVSLPAAAAYTSVLDLLFAGEANNSDEGIDW